MSLGLSLDFAVDFEFVVIVDDFLASASNQVFFLNLGADYRPGHPELC